MKLKTIQKSIFVKGKRIYYPMFGVDKYTHNFSWEYGGKEIVSRFEYDRGYSDSLAENEIIRTVYIPMPLLQVGDEFYFEDTNQAVEILKVIRTSEDNVVYVVDLAVVDT